MQNKNQQHLEDQEQRAETLGRKNLPDLFRQIFLTAPVAQTVVGPGGALLPNQACRDLLVRCVGVHPRAWLRYLDGALARILASGKAQDVIRSVVAGQPDLVVEAGPQVHALGLRVLTLRPALERNDSRESLAQTVSILCHELRTPLASMKSSLEVVSSGEAGPLHPDQERFLGMTARNVDRLHRLVDDLLDTSRAAADGLFLEATEMDLIPLLSETVRMLQEQARQAQIRLEDLEGPAELPARVDGDKVVQMLTNVLGNALKYTPAGGVVHVRVEAEQEDGRFLMEIEDSGPGMDPEACRRALEPFQRAHDEAGLRVPGTGLGLHITRGLARAHGGDLELDSTPGRGTRVRILLPRNVQSHQPEFSG